LIIFVPYGDIDDQTRLPEFYDNTYDYLNSLGIRDLSEESNNPIASDT
jgi:hypothetical protein